MHRQSQGDHTPNSSIGLQITTLPKKIFLWNATNVKEKLPELEVFLQNNNIDVALITETWLLPTDRFYLKDYISIRKDRATRGGEWLYSSTDPLLLKILGERQPTAWNTKQSELKPIPN